MLAMALLAASLAPPPEPDLDRFPVLAGDVRAFRVDAECAYRMWQIALSHPKQVEAAVRSNNLPDVVAAWAAECRWRCECWSLLDDVLRCYADEPTQVGKLRELLKCLGREHYYGGAMPAPIPTYRTHD